MKIKPILFSTPMVEAILDGSKTQTRRTDFEAEIGDILWVRETFQVTDWIHPSNDEWGYIYKASENGREWASSEEDWKWKPSIFMPKPACRIFLEVTDKRLEKLQYISTEDIYAEGIKVSHELELGRSKTTPINFLPKGYGLIPDLNPKKEIVYALAHWASLWASINGIESWNENPEIKAYTFKQVERPKDFLLNYKPTIKKSRKKRN